MECMESVFFKSTTLQLYGYNKAELYITSAFPCVSVESISYLHFLVSACRILAGLFNIDHSLQMRVWDGVQSNSCYSYVLRGVYITVENNTKRLIEIANMYAP